MNLIPSLFTILCAIGYAENAALPFYPQHEESTVKIDASYLLWQLSQDELIIATDNYYIPATTSPSQGQSYGPLFPFQNGFQLTMRVQPDSANPIEWAVIFSWLAPEKKPSTSKNTGIDTFPIFSVDPQMPVPNRTQFLYDHYSWFKNHYALLDFEYKRPTQLIPSFILSPSVGLRTTWQQQIWYSNELMFTVNPISSDYIYDFTQNFWGIGPKIGMNGTFYFFRNIRWINSLALVFKSAFSTICAPTTVKINYSAKTATSHLTFYDSAIRIFPIIPVIDLSVGINYTFNDPFSTPFLQQIDINLLWETQTWIGLNRMLSSYPLYLTPSTLTIQGLSVGLGVTF